MNLVEVEKLRNSINHYYRLVKYYDRKNNKILVSRYSEAYYALIEFYDSVIGDGNYATL